MEAFFYNSDIADIEQVVRIRTGETGSEAL